MCKPIPDLRPIVIDFGSTKSYRSRTATYSRNRDLAARFDGHLTIAVAKSATRIEKIEYKVRREKERLPGYMTFRLLKAGANAAYEVTISRRHDGSWAPCLCTCEAARYRIECKHPEAMAAIVEAGGFEDPKPALPPAPPSPVVPPKILSRMKTSLDGEGYCCICLLPLCGEPGPAHKGQCSRDLAEEDSLVSAM